MHIRDYALGDVVRVATDAEVAAFERAGRPDMKPFRVKDYPHPVYVDGRPLHPSARVVRIRHGVWALAPTTDP